MVSVLKYLNFLIFEPWMMGVIVSPINQFIESIDALSIFIEIDEESPMQAEGVVIKPIPEKKV